MVMHIIQKLLISVLLVVAVSFAQQSDTASQKGPQVQPTIASSLSVKDVRPLNKQLYIRKNPTTWTKIKDLFM